MQQQEKTGEFGIDEARRVLGEGFAPESLARAPGTQGGGGFFRACSRFSAPASSCRGLSRASTYFLCCWEKDGDGRDKPGHDGKRIEKLTSPAPLRRR